MEYPKDINDALLMISESMKVYHRDCETMELDALHRLQDRLSTVLYYVGEEEAKYKSDYNFTRFKREISFSRARMAFRKEHNGGDSDTKASQAVEDDKQVELQHEAIAYRLQNAIKRADKVLQAISQHITTKRDDKQYNRKLNSL